MAIGEEEEEMTAMGDAFERAGFKTDRDRINDMLYAAVEKHGGNAAAVADFARRLLAEDNAKLIWEFFASDREMRLWKEMERMTRQIREERGLDQPAPKPQKQQKKSEGQRNAAEQSATEAPPSDAVAGSGQRSSASNGHTNAAAPGLRPSPALKEIARDSLLYGPQALHINGRPIGRCSARTAREWAWARGREYRYALLLTEGLSDDMIIGESKTEDDAHTALRLAREQSNG